MQVSTMVLRTSPCRALHGVFMWSGNGNKNELQATLYRLQAAVVQYSWRFEMEAAVSIEGYNFWKRKTS